jgi:hypothetical protein
VKIFLIKFAVGGLLLSSCSNSISTVASTVAVQPPSTVSTTSTSLKPPATTVTLPRFPATPANTPIPEPEVPRAKIAAGECEHPEGSHYCIWGTEPLDLVVNNSSIANVQHNMVQTFTAVRDKISMVELALQTFDTGELLLLNPSQSQTIACISVHLMSESGLRIASASYGDAGGFGRLQQVEAPLNASLVVGRKYQLQIVKEPACVSRSLAVRIATASAWRYPKASGRLFLDSEKWTGSLWARIK